MCKIVDGGLLMWFCLVLLMWKREKELIEEDGDAAEA
jgi:hypothetical protein